MGNLPLGTVAITEESATRWTGLLTPTSAYARFRPLIQGDLPHIVNTVSDPVAFMTAFQQARAKMRRLNLRLEDDSGALIATSEIVLADAFPPDAPEDIFPHVTILVLIERGESYS